MEQPMIDQVCRIWNTIAECSALQSDRIKINSARAGGAYTLDADAQFDLNSLSQIDKAKLTTWLVDQRLQGDSCPHIDCEKIDFATRRKRLSITERIDKALLCYSKNQRAFGQELMLWQTDGPVKHLDPFLAWTESANPEEFSALLRMMREARFVRPDLDDRFFGLASEGYRRLEHLESSSVDSSQAFIAMWFDQSLDDAAKNGFEAGIRDAGYKPFRIDSKEHNNKIDDEIIAEIRRSRFVVADFTCGVIDTDEEQTAIARGGVYYEAGFAQGLGLPVIWSCRSDRLKYVHFDTRQFNHIEWHDPPDLREKLKNRIGAVLGQGPVPI